MQNRDPELSRQGREFDVHQDPDVLRIAQKVIGWICVAATVGMLLTQVPSLLVLVGF